MQLFANLTRLDEERQKCPAANASKVPSSARIQNCSPITLLPNSIVLAFRQVHRQQTPRLLCSTLSGLDRHSPFASHAWIHHAIIPLPGQREGRQTRDHHRAV